jgi:hypothetical protein
MLPHNSLTANHTYPHRGCFNITQNRTLIVNVQARPLYGCTACNFAESSRKWFHVMWAPFHQACQIPGFICI